LQFVRQHDRVVFHRAADPAFRRRVIAHAAAHLLLDHAGVTGAVPQVAVTPLTGIASGNGITAEHIRTSLSSAAADDHVEAEAAILTDLLVTRSARSSPMRGRPA
jgi:hypothetical protein